MRVRYRPFQAVAIATLAALITACAGFAPLYDRAMRQALTDVELDHATTASAGLRLFATTEPANDYAPHNRAVPPEPEEVVSAVPPALRDFYFSPVLGYSAVATEAPGERTEPGGTVIWRDGMCDHLTFVDGRCPSKPGEVAVSEKDVDLFGLDVGSRFSVFGIPGNGAHATIPLVRMTVTGVYRQRPGDYWFGLELTGRSGTMDPGIQHDVWIVDRSTFTSPTVPPLVERTSTVDFPLDRASMGVDDLLSLSDRLGRLHSVLAAERPDLRVDYYSGVPDIAQDVRSQSRQSRVTVPLLMAQLGLLAVVVLWLVLLAVTEQRRPEVALARLRGRGLRGARGMLLGELLPITLAGVVPGVLLAVFGTWIVRTFALPGSAPFELGLRLVAAIAVATALLVGVTVVAVARVAREPVERLLRRVPPRRTGWGLGVADACMIAGAGGVVVVFAAGGLDGPIALAAPGLVAIVVGLILAHLTTPTAAIVGRRLLRRGRATAGVSVLDAARSPATRRVVAIVTLSSALAVFSADALLVGERNRELAADQQVGARMVAVVHDTDLRSVRAALDEVDPDGTSVTPVVRMLPSGSDTGGTLAVVPDSFRAIALFPGGAAPASVWEPIRTPDVEPIRLTGTHLEVDVVDSTLGSRRLDGGTYPVSIGVDLVTPRGETLHTTLGQLPHGVRRAHFATDVSCGDGCFVTTVWMSTLPAATIDGGATLRDLTTQPGGEVVQLGPASRWTPFADPSGRRMEPSSVADDELTVGVHNDGPSQISMRQNWLPTVDPALASGAIPPDSRDRFDILGLDGETQPAVRVGTLPRVPGSRPGTTVVNLDVLERGVDLDPDAQIEVWFADDDPDLLADVTDALAEREVTITSSTRLGDVRRVYDESTAAWSLQLAALVGAAALLIALLVLVVSAVSSWRFRTRDLASLRMSGIPGRAITAMAVAAQLPAVLLGVVAGAAAGLFGAQLALPIVPLFASAPAVSTLDLDVAWIGAVVATVAAVAVLGLGTVVIGRATAARSDVRRLRDTV